MTRDEFITAYAAELKYRIHTYPHQYARGLVPEVVAAKMATAIEADSFDTDAPALKALLKKHGVAKYSRKAASDWYKANVEA